MNVKQWIDKQEDWLKQPASMFGLPRAVIIIAGMLALGAVAVFVIITTP